jgi:prepilin-type processing-associated H-X9-DG protein
LSSCETAINTYSANVNPSVYSWDSQHQGGAQFAFADGHVQFISEVIDFADTGVDSSQGAFQNMCDRADRQPVSVDP